MVYEKRYRTVVPVEKGSDIQVARWLARESFETTATSDCVVIVEYGERPMSVDEIPPTALAALGRPLTDFDWFEFTGVGRLNKPLFDWLSAECAWRNEQTKLWLDAELKEWLAAEWAWKCEAANA